MTFTSLHERYNTYHYCVVRECKNTTVKTPGKLWIRVPQEINMRKTWLKLARRDPDSISTASNIYFCEDHFDLENDMENYMRYKIMGSVKRIRMKSNCIPTRFDFQTDRPPTSDEHAMQQHASNKIAVLHNKKTTITTNLRAQMEQDMENYVKYKMGFNQTILMVKGAMPSKFHCQEDCSERLSDTTLSQTSYIKCLKTDIDEETQAGISTLKDDNAMPETAVKMINPHAKRKLLKISAVPSLNLPHNKNKTSIKEHAGPSRRNLQKKSVQESLEQDELVSTHKDALLDGKHGEFTNEILNIATDDIKIEMDIIKEEFHLEEHLKKEPFVENFQEDYILSHEENILDTDSHRTEFEFVEVKEYDPEENFAEDEN